MVNDNRGVSLVELMVAIGIMAIGVYAVMSMTKVDSNSTKQIVAQDAKAYIAKEILTVLESKANCEALLKNKSVGAALSFVSTDGITINQGAVINKTHKIVEFKYKFLTAANLPSDSKFIDIYYVLSPTREPAKKVTEHIRIVGKAGSSVTSCISPREDGGLLVQAKAIQLAKVRVCTEDLKGTLQANGICNWPEPFTTVVVPVQL